MATLLAHQPVPGGQPRGDRHQRGRPGDPRGRRLRGATACACRCSPRRRRRRCARSCRRRRASRNPVDMIASATPEQYRRALEVVAADPAVDSIIAIFIPPLVTEPEAVAAAIRGAASRTSQADPRDVPRHAGRAAAARAGAVVRISRSRPPRRSRTSTRYGEWLRTTGASRRSRCRKSRARACAPSSTGAPRQRRRLADAARVRSAAGGRAALPVLRSRTVRDRRRGGRGGARGRFPGRAEGGRQATSCTRATSAASALGLASEQAVRDAFAALSAHARRPARRGPGAADGHRRCRDGRRRRQRSGVRSGRDVRHRRRAGRPARRHRVCHVPAGESGRAALLDARQGARAPARLPRRAGRRRSGVPPAARPRLAAAPRLSRDPRDGFESR